MTLPKILQSLKLQISIAIASLTVLFAVSILYSLHVIDQQHSDDVLVQLAGRLQFNQQRLTVQAMRYQENAPRDYPSYFRDLRLYFEDQKKTRAEMSRIIEAFATNRFDSSLIGETMRMPPQLPERSLAMARDLAAVWEDFLAKLNERIGPDLEEPRLEWAAEWIVEQNATLEEISERLLSTLENDVSARAAAANLVNRLLLAAALMVAVGIAVWFYRRVLQPLSAAVEGFKQVANGDFSYRIAVTQDNEIGWLATAFNHLSGRMEALRRLLTGLEQGASLEGTLHILSETLPPLIPVDWIGVLVLGPDGRIHLEKAFSDGKPDPLGKLNFEPDKTLLEECIRNREPLHIPDVREIATLSDKYVFLSQLSELGRRDAIFLPIGSSATVQGVAVFASRFPNNYRPEHLALLRNLGVLVGVSLARTIQLVESTRLASIGQFASGIVHEIRNPLATISLALEHLKDLTGLPGSTHKRVDLADNEVRRLERLLDDILLYAKPLTLSRRSLDIDELIADVIGGMGQDSAPIVFRSDPCPAVSADPDRIRQVLINLLRNAQQASPTGASVQVRCRPSTGHRVEVEIRNGGEPIPEQTLARIFEPFFTSKPGGTGLGLPIVQRIVDAHGGQITLESDTQNGTRALLTLPVISA
jgi:signal transduction histidine kinase